VGPKRPVRSRRDFEPEHPVDPAPLFWQELVATLYCPCGQAHELWAEFWWTEGRYQWIFFDYEHTSETYAEQVECCPACGRRLERKNLLS
jgi:hypothetical protein